MGNGWDKGSWALRMRPYLSGEGQAACMALSEEQAWDDDEVNVAILDSVGLLVEKDRQKCRPLDVLRSATQGVCTKINRLSNLLAKDRC